MGSTNMFKQERFQKIIGYLEANSRATISELAGYLYVSEATVRRDLTEMQKLGTIQKTHGGAMLKTNVDEVSIFIRAQRNIKEKGKTVDIALANFPDFETIFIDNSSTSLNFINKFDFSYKTCVTNGLQAAMALSRMRNVKVIMLGGDIAYNTDSADGLFAVDMMKEIKVDLMLTSCAGITDGSSYEVSNETRLLKKTAFDQARIRVLVADSSKFGAEATYRTQRLEDYDYIFTNADDEKLAGYDRDLIHFVNK